MMSQSKTIRFHQWRKEKAVKEQSYMQIAILLEPYLVPATLAQIRKDVESSEPPSAAYQQIRTGHRHYIGVLLYLILELDETIELLAPSLEKTLLSKIRTELAAVYNDYTDSPAKRLNSFLDYASDFINIDAQRFAYKIKIKQLHQVIYLTLCTLSNKLNNLPKAARLLARMYKLNFNEIHGRVNVLMNQIETKSCSLIPSPVKTKTTTNTPTKLEIAPKEDPGIKPLTPKKRESWVDELDREELKIHSNVFENFECYNVIPLTLAQQEIKSHLDRHFNAIFIGEGTSQEKLKALLTLSAQHTALIYQLITKRNKEEPLINERKQLTELVKGFKENETYIIGRKYFQTLYVQHHNAFNFIATSLPMHHAKKRALKENIVAQQHRIKTGKSLYLISTIASPLISLSRTLLPIKTQNYIGKWSFETLDSEAKTLAIELAEEVINKVDRQLELINREKLKLQKELCLDNSNLESLIIKASSECLKRIASLYEIKETYETLAAKLVSKSPPVFPVKAQIQELFQKRYLFLLQEDKDESDKVDGLITLMRQNANQLQVLWALNIKKEGLYSKLYPLLSLINVLNKTPNSDFAMIPQKELEHLRKQFSELMIEIKNAVVALAADNKLLGIALIQTNVDQLYELVRVNEVDLKIDGQLLSIVTPLTIDKALMIGEPTLQESFNKRFLSLLNNDAYEEDQRLSNLECCIRDVDTKLGYFISARDGQEALALRCAQVKSILEILESNGANVLLINLIRERFNYLEQKLARVKVETLAIADTLAEKDQSLKTLLFEEKSQVVLDVITANKAAIDCIEQFKLLKGSILMLHQIRKGTRNLEYYVVTHDTWWVRFTNFLAKFFSIFKSSTAKMIERAEELKFELNNCKKQCEQEISKHINLIKEEPNVGDELLGDLPFSHNYPPPSSDELLEAWETDKTQGLLSQVSLFQPKGRKSEPILAEEQMKTESFDSYSGGASEVIG